MKTEIFNSLMILFLVIWVTILKFKYFNLEDEIEKLKERIKKLEYEN